MIHVHDNDESLCSGCGWPRSGAYHEEVHPRMVRYDFTVTDVPFTAVRDWQDWSPEWRTHFIGMVAADRAKLAQKNQWELGHYWITAYDPKTEAINFHVDLGLVTQ